MPAPRMCSARRGAWRQHGPLSAAPRAFGAPALAAAALPGTSFAHSGGSGGRRGQSPTHAAGTNHSSGIASRAAWQRNGDRGAGTVWLSAGT
jgi:hypothetical protein